MRRNIALRLQYDGTAYHGWQVQKTDITVAETLERALTKVCGEPIKVVGCGRTDAGVHAKRYCANFRTDCTIPIDRVPLAVNARLPADIAVVDAVAAPEDGLTQSDVALLSDIVLSQTSCKLSDIRVIGVEPEKGQ